MRWSGYARDLAFLILSVFTAIASIVAFVLLVLGAPDANARPYPHAGGYQVTAPTRCAAAGMTELSWSLNKMFDGAHVDRRRAYKPGFGLYEDNLVNLSTTAPTPIGANAQLNADNSVTIAGGTANSGFSSAGITTAGSHYLGHVFGPGMCPTATVSWNPANTDWVDNLAPAFWMTAWEQYVGGAGWSSANGGCSDCVFFFEIDFSEFRQYQGDSQPQILTSLGAWYGSPTTGACAPRYCVLWQSVPSNLPSNFDWTVPHTITAVIIPSTSAANGTATVYVGTPGSSTDYQVAQFTWTHSSNGFPSGSVPTTADAGRSLDWQHGVLQYGSSAPLGLDGGLTVYSTGVFQSQAQQAGNLFN